MHEPFLGEVTIFGGNFAPRGWEFCNGQLLKIAENTALFSLLGTTYGGDGRRTFGLPDLRSRVPIHAGRVPGGPSIQPGETGEPLQTDTDPPGSLGLNYIIATVGTYPSRS